MLSCCKLEMIQYKHFRKLETSNCLLNKSSFRCVSVASCFCKNAVNDRFLERKIWNPLAYVADKFKKIKGLRTALSCQC